jgi:hypothetical protein
VLPDNLKPVWLIKTCYEYNGTHFTKEPYIAENPVEAIEKFKASWDKAATEDMWDVPLKAIKKMEVEFLGYLNE